MPTTSAGVTMLTPAGQSGRLITGLPSSRDAGDLAGVHLVSVAPDGKTIHVGAFGQDALWTYVAELPLPVPAEPLTPNQLTRTMLPLNNVRLVNPFAMTYAADGRPVIVTDASGNGVATTNPDGTTRFIHRFELLPNPQRPTDPIEAVPTGIERIGDEYYVTLFGGCPYPAQSGQLVAIDEQRNQRTVAKGLNLPIDVAQASDGTVWVLEFANFTAGASCFDGSGYQPRSGRLSRLLPDGRLEQILTNLDFPGALLPMPDGSFYLTEVMGGRVLHITFGDGEVVGSAAVTATVPVTATAVLAVTAPTAATLHFRNVASEVGLRFRHGAFQRALSMDPVAAMGAGLCWIDYDNDGWLDLYLVNSHALDETAYWQANGGLPQRALPQQQAPLPR
ncbi:MAG: ScyD/ScyE family protein [Caldilineaceae bacterium]